MWSFLIAIPMLLGVVYHNPHVKLVRHEVTVYEQPLSVEYLDELRSKISRYVDDRAQALGSEYFEEIKSFMSAIIEDESFQRNPYEYMIKWKDRRGYTCEFRVAEDSAMAFFEEQFKSVVFIDNSSESICF